MHLHQLQILAEAWLKSILPTTKPDSASSGTEAAMEPSASGEAATGESV
jgi:hypothetical protein